MHLTLAYLTQSTAAFLPFNWKPFIWSLKHNLLSQYNSKPRGEKSIQEEKHNKKKHVFVRQGSLDKGSSDKIKWSAWHSLDQQAPMKCYEERNFDDTKAYKKSFPHLNEGKHTENHWYTAALFHYLNSVLKSIMAIVSSDKPDQEHS